MRKVVRPTEEGLVSLSLALVVDLGVKDILDSSALVGETRRRHLRFGASHLLESERLNIALAEEEGLGLGKEERSVARSSGAGSATKAVDVLLRRSRETDLEDGRDLGWAKRAVSVRKRGVFRKAKTTHSGNVDATSGDVG